MQITLKFRSDVFRRDGLRKVRAKANDRRPNESRSELIEQELFSFVTDETGKHLAECPFYLPDLAAVLSEEAD